MKNEYDFSDGIKNPYADTISQHSNKHQNVWATYFSATGTTKKIVATIADILSNRLTVEYNEFDFTLPEARSSEKAFSETDIVVFGVPVIAGRVPNVLLKYMSMIKGNGALAIPIVLFGNRNFDDALIELRDILENDGFHTIAAGAFVGEHSFSDELAKGRPDTADMSEAHDFAVHIAEKISSGNYNINSPVQVDGTPFPYSGYYQPRDRHGEPIDIRKVKPVTDDKCIDCKLCAKICPMGSIDFDDVSLIDGICIKCCACVKKCPVRAKHFDDSGFIYHKEELEDMYKRRGVNQIFI